MAEQPQKKIEPGVCIPWAEKRREFPEIRGDEQIVKRVWEEVDALAYMYIWQCLLSF
jgi:hypothetical protein